MNKAEAESLGAEVEQAIAPVLAAHGVELKKVRGSFGDAALSLRIEIVEAAPAGMLYNPKSEEAQAFVRWAEMEGLRPENLGESFTVKGKRYTIIGLRARAKKAPILTKDEAGRSYAWASDAVKRLLTRAEAAS